MTQWLPLLGSLIVAAAVLGGILGINRTNREAIAAADERGRQALDAAQRHIELSNMVGDQRDHEAWRREAVLAAVASILETSASVRSDLASVQDWDLVTADEIDNVSADIHKVIWGRPASMLPRLRVVAQRRISSKCEDLLRTLTAAQHITMQRLKLHIDVEATVDELEEMAELWQKAMRHAAEQERALVETTRTELGIATKSSAPQPVSRPEPVAQRVELEHETPEPQAAPEPATAQVTAEPAAAHVSEGSAAEEHATPAPQSSTPAPEDAPEQVFIQQAVATHNADQRPVAQV
ncbi:hypothetical protein [Nocardia camponoti]|uniref:Uncharacterized protein n=1 Tax=Nocardia camponoti TaxID=1616106 RepID=A0A917QJU4_9NOCA|nr:hypothetical protein [Nocardia camponoti]GGK53962.1 hypothetical protein GCM10011591_27200 [Nocardia camponoti]